ncbi:MAG: rane-bound lytic murein transglycosylase [Desulfovibrionales bacterium]|nr:rane-bound lytic murein transglycosylase [Desulfovibrionales bacterium]
MTIFTSATFKTCARTFIAAALAASLLAVLLFSGCVRPTQQDLGRRYEIISYRESLRLARRLDPASQGLCSWTDLEDPLLRSLSFAEKKPDGALAVDTRTLKITWGRVQKSLRLMLSLLHDLDADPGLLAQKFQWLRIRPQTLMTGYYEPSLNASLTPDPAYPYPLYGPPPDLRKVDLGAFHHRWKGQTLIYRMTDNGIEPYPDRDAIDYKGALDGEGAEIAWAQDPVDVFFLQIQGSGRLALPDGSVRHILYADKNGRPYVSIGRVLIERGLLPAEGMSMQAIRQFIGDHPDMAGEILRQNPSYVFFRLADSGPIGASGEILAPKVSLAVDRSFIPMSGLLAMHAEIPSTEGPRELQGIGLAQDTGGAIQGNHVDLFCGSGEEAAHTAGGLKTDATLHLLLARE